MVPAKVVRDWKTLLIAGQPLYPQVEEEEEGERSSGSRGSQSTCSVPPSDLVRESLLEETDFWQYRVRRPLHTPPHYTDSSIQCIFTHVCTQPQYKACPS